MITERRQFGIGTDTLKIIAIVCMVCDHLPFLNPDALFGVAGSSSIYYGFPLYLLHSIGRITAPIFFYMVAAGYRRTHDTNRYAIRLFIFACISYVPAIWYFYGSFPNGETFLDFNVLFSMFFGLMLLRSIHEVRNLPLKILCILLCLAAFYFTEFGFFAAGLILVFDLFRKSKVQTGIAAVVVTLAYIFQSIGFNLSYYTASAFGWHVLIVMFSMLLPLILILLCRKFYPRGTQGDDPAGTVGDRSYPSRFSAIPPRRSPFRKWFFYVFYPGHLTLLLLIRMFFLS
ncbi:MAG: conjugal transfer protein TraX [Clostridiales Family XIII bacterium]|jgi:hypothetical protein|nr:conjugal transfer protein TraX [Clostridiales Family XIII bacterium]